jgi:hypothetical protein
MPKVSTYKFYAYATGILYLVRSENFSSHFKG